MILPLIFNLFILIYLILELENSSKTNRLREKIEIFLLTIFSWMGSIYGLLLVYPFLKQFAPTFIYDPFLIFLEYYISITTEMFIWYPSQPFNLEKIDDFNPSVLYIFPFFIISSLPTLSYIIYKRTSKTPIPKNKKSQWLISSLCLFFIIFILSNGALVLT